MIDSISQLKRLRRCHAGNKPAKQLDDLLVGVAIAVVDYDTRFEPRA